MKIGNLIKLKKPRARDIYLPQVTDLQEVFVVSDVMVDLYTGVVWVKLLEDKHRDTGAWSQSIAYEVI
jgi:hypothetical protein